jgi:hypothetical protein
VDDGSAVVGNAGGDAEAAMSGAMALSSDVVPTAEDEVWLSSIIYVDVNAFCVLVSV